MKQEQRILDLCEPGTTLVTRYVKAKSKVTLACKEGHQREIIPDNLFGRGNGKVCKVCVPAVSEFKKSDKQVAYELATFGLEAAGPYLGARLPMQVRAACGHEFSTYLTNIVNKGIGYVCRTCTPNRNRLRTQEAVAEDLKALGLELIEEYTHARTNVLVRGKCGHEFEVRPNNVFSRNGAICKVCFPSTSGPEKELSDFISSIYSGNIVIQDRKIIAPKELDIYLPDKAIAFEFNGVYWHSDKFKEKDYHLNKHLGCKKENVRLVMINEDEFYLRPGIVKSRIRAILGANYKVYAKYTTVRKIGYPEGFLNDNHIQGAGSPTSFNYGLFLKDELIAVMTFSKGRFNTDCDYELVRYCSIVDVNVVGGASKLLKAFRSENAGSIVSYADLRWSDGGLYRMLGFEHSHNSTPNYKYYKGRKSLTRYQCTKDNLATRFPEIYSEDLTEREIMDIAGYHVVYDCGNMVWKLK